MANETKAVFLRKLSTEYGPIRKIGNSQSLYEICNGNARVYIRYSKIHSKNQAFYGLRAEDLQKLEGHPAFICLLWDHQAEPLLIPFSEYEDVFQSTSPARDGQYKVQIYLQDDGTELYIPKAGKFNAEGYFGWSALAVSVDLARYEAIPEFSHSQIQTMLGAIGKIKGYDIWVPQSDRTKLDWSITERFKCCDILPYGFDQIKGIIQEVDVIWIQRGSSDLAALFEVEHSTPIYSGLLRFNDIHLVAPNLRPQFSVVSNDARHGLFIRQLNRPTFQMSGLSKLCTFLEYINVYGWYNRMNK